MGVPQARWMVFVRENIPSFEMDDDWGLAPWPWTPPYQFIEIYIPNGYGSLDPGT